MPRVPRTTLMAVLAAVLVVSLLGTMIGAFVAFFPQSSGDDQASTPTATTQPTSSPPPTATPTDSKSMSVNGVSLTLTDVRKSTDPKGYEVLIDLANQSKGAIAFAFFPARDISLGDDLGSNYDFRWAEYAGNVIVEPGKKAQLVRAFFAGPSPEGKPEHFTVSLAGVPQVGKATWEVEWPDTATKPIQITAKTASPTPEAEKPSNGVGGMITQNKVSVTLASAEPNSELGGLQIVLSLLNNSAGELSFPFSPEKNISVVDNRGSKFNLRWAEYGGNVQIGRGKQIQLVKAFYEGPMADPSTNTLTISVSAIPEFGDATWQVALR